MRQLDLNADVGEGLPETDAALLELVTSANIACGLHAGGALGHPFTAEAFAARRDRSDGSLTARSESGAVLTDPDLIAAQVRRLVTDGEVVSGDGTRVPVAFETLCLHGDTPGSAALAARIRQELGALGVSVSAPRLLGVDTLPP